MIKYIFFALFLLFPLLACAQKDSSSVIIRFNGGYADTGSSNGVASLGSTASNSRDWNVGLTVGLPVGKRWEVGLGFEYWKQRTIAESTIYFPNQSLYMQFTETDVNLIIGKAYISGHWKLFNRLYFSPILSMGIGKAKGTQSDQTAFSHNLQEQQYLSYMVGGESKISYDYFAIGLAPTFSYYFNRHFALNLETGNFRFATTDWEWSNKQWLANANPAYWQLGAIIAF